MGVKGIIFDLGGVIIDINYQLTINMFKQLGASNFDKVYSQFKQSDLFDQYETGLIDCEIFRKNLLKELNLATISISNFEDAWNAMLLQTSPQEKLSYIRKLRNSGYKTILFSNTNPIHLKRVFEICKQTTGLDNFLEFFDAEYYSHLFGYRKPCQEAFVKILAEQNLTPEETLFIDDSKQHILGAQSIGIQAELIKQNSSLATITQLITKYCPNGTQENIADYQSNEILNYGFS